MGRFYLKSFNYAPSYSRHVSVSVLARSKIFTDGRGKKWKDKSASQLDLSCDWSVLDRAIHDNIMW